MLFQRFLKKVIALNNWLIFSSSTLLIMFSTIIMRQLEPETFPSYFDSFWWVMTTVTTVGYGDFYPVTIPGRLYAVFLYILGIGLIGVVIGKVIDGFSQLRLKQEEGKMSYSGKDHIIIIGWSKKADYALKEIFSSEPNQEVVLISTLEKTPMNHPNFHFVQGDATKEEILNMANIAKAKSVIIFADDSIEDSQLTDGKSLLIATAIERYAGDLHIAVELLVEKHTELFKHVSVDEFIISDETVSKMAVQAVLSKGVTTIYNQLMSRTQGHDLYQIPVSPKWKTYRDAFLDLLEQGATLISDHDQMDINSRLDEFIRNDSILYIISDRDTYLRLLSNYTKKES